MPEQLAWTIWFPPIFDGCRSSIHTETVCGRKADVWDRFLALKDEVSPDFDPDYPRGASRAERIAYLRRDGARVIRVRIAYEDTPLTPAVRRQGLRYGERCHRAAMRWLRERTPDSQGDCP